MGTVILLAIFSLLTFLPHSRPEIVLFNKTLAHKTCFRICFLGNPEKDKENEKLKYPGVGYLLWYYTWIWSLCWTSGLKTGTFWVGLYDVLSPAGVRLRWAENQTLFSFRMSNFNSSWIHTFEFHVKSKPLNERRGRNRMYVSRNSWKSQRTFTRPSAVSFPCQWKWSIPSAYDGCPSFGLTIYSHFTSRVWGSYFAKISWNVRLYVTYVNTHWNSLSVLFPGMISCSNTGVKPPSKGGAPWERWEHELDYGKESEII